VVGALLELAGVAAAFEAAKAAVDAAFAHPALPRLGGALAVQASVSAAAASAALEGHAYDLAAIRAGTVTDAVVQGALRIGAATASLTPIWPVAPRQVLARLHTLAARGCPGVPDAMLGRPAQPESAVSLLDEVCAIVTDRRGGWPAQLRAAVVHGRLLAGRPFAGPNGVVARAAARLTLIADGFDPRGLLALDEAHLRLRPQYLGCAHTFATGTPDGVRAWLKHCAEAARQAAAVLTSDLNRVSHDPPETAAGQG
jgi:hypothetical protein